MNPIICMLNSKLLKDSYMHAEVMLWPVSVHVVFVVRERNTKMLFRFII